MIETVPYTIGFIIYVGFCIITFDAYSKKNEMTKILILIFIYAFYTLLAAYVMSFVDFNASFFEKFIEIIVYAIAAGIYLYFHYKNIIEKSDLDAGYDKLSKNQLF